MDKAYGFAFVRFHNAPTSVSACSTNGYWHFTVPLTTKADEKLFAVLVTAKLANAPVHALGIGSCNEFGTIESLQSANLK